ncbi:MAG: hypothetical protein ACE37F_00410 [Nannocystaceae bacterium]|nr:hypothetical protein [bacterium]
MTPKAISPGSREPSAPAEIDTLLTFVPELSFFREFDDCVPTVGGTASHEEVDAHYDDAALEPVLVALRSLAERASADANGGLAFLVRTMLHFLQAQKVPPSQHPLLVALYLRGTARATGSTENARTIASLMDRWG